MPPVKTVTLPEGGQHFFFNCGGNNLLAFSSGRNPLQLRQISQRLPARSRCANCSRRSAR